MVRFAAMLAVAACGAVAAAGSPASTPATKTNGLIAFVSDRAADRRGEIYSAAVGGSSRRDLSRSPYADSDPVVSPNGRRLAFFSGRGGVTALYTANVDGSGLRRVTKVLAKDSGEGGFAFGGIAWSPDGHLIAYHGESGLHVVRLGTGKSRWIADGLLPSWSADGRRLAFLVTHHEGDNRVVVVRADGRRLWSRRGTSPQWSPRGRLLAYESLGDHTRTTVTTASGHVVAGFRGSVVSWSPDGRRLALERGNALVVAILRTRRSQSLATNATWVAWSPDSRRMAFTGSIGGRFTSWVAPVAGPARALGRAEFVAGWSGGWILLAGDVPVNDSPRALDVVHPNGRGFRRVLRVPAGSALSSFGLARGGRIVVYRSESTSPGALFTVDPQGKHLQRLTRDGNGTATPAWSPDGHSIAFARTDVVGRCHGCDWDLALLRTRTAEIIRVRGSQVSSPTWSPSGDRIAYGDASETGLPTIYTVAADGSGRAAIGPGAEPDWSPSGLEIAYSGNGSLSVMHPDGSQVRPLGVQGESPAWSPDGDWIAFVRSGGISEVHPDGTGVRTIVETDSTPTAVAWSPDGQTLVYAQRPYLYVVGADGSGKRQLTRGLASDDAPSWQPLPSG